MNVPRKSALLEAQGFVQSMGMDARNILKFGYGTEKTRADGIDDIQTAVKTSRHSKIKAHCAVSGSPCSSTRTADSLAGRMRVLKLWPLTVSEIRKRRPSRILTWALSPAPKLSALPTPEKTGRQAYIDIILRGGFPEISPLATEERQEYYRDYVDAIVDRDVADILPVRKTDALRRLISQLAVRTAMELNLSEICELIGVQRNPLEQYLEVLSRLSVATKLGAWASGESRREIKNAKTHFVDTGVACALRRLTSESFHADTNPAALGGLMESFVYSELMRSAPYQDQNFRFYHWRDSRGHEIDILAESATRLIGIEVKASTALSSQDFKHLRWFAEKGPGTTKEVTGLVFHLGQEKLSFGNGFFALPVSTLWSIGP